MTSIELFKSEIEIRRKAAKWFSHYDLDQLSAEEIHLMDIESSKYINHKVKTTFIAAGRGAVYFVPVQFQVSYILYLDKGKKEFLKKGFVISLNNPVLLKMCRVSDDRQQAILRRYAVNAIKSPRKIKITDLKILKSIAITELIAFPKVKELTLSEFGKIVDDEGREYRQKVISVQEATSTTSKTFEATGFVLADPKTAESHFMVTEFKEIKEDYEKFELTPDIRRQFEVIKRRSNESIETYLDRYIESAAYHFIRIYGEARKDAIIANFLCYHSPLYFMFEDEPVNGWLQINFVGDTTTGKSQIAKRTRAYINIGIYVTGETCSRTGFLYSIDTKTTSTYILRWGMLPQQDGSLLIIDGSNYISPEDWGMAREARRSGVLKVERIVSGEHPCRTRLISCANLEKNLRQYQYPCKGLEDLLESPDISRTDLVVFFDITEVNKEEINIPHEDREIPELKINKEFLRNSVLWAFSRKIKDIIFGKDSVKTVNEVANSLLSKFGSATKIPLVGNDIKYKVARIAVALATFLHNTDESHEKVFITPEIVNAAGNFIDKVYSAKNCRLDAYATDMRSKVELSDEEYGLIKQSLEEAKETDKSKVFEPMIEIFRTHERIRLADLTAKLDKSDSAIKTKISFFRKHGLIWTTQRGYAKTEKFIQFLNRRAEEKQKTLTSLKTGLNVTPRKKFKIKLKKKQIKIN